MEAKVELSDLNRLALDALPVAVTITDPEGIILYYNPCAKAQLDRKPEYIGRDIRFCHKEQKSIDKIDNILSAFRKGSFQDFRYEAVRTGQTLSIIVSPLVQGDVVAGVVHTVIVKPETD